ncbi:hypothetical protein GCM10022397_05410 [Flavivirga jejuensis]
MFFDITDRQSQLLDKAVNTIFKNKDIEKTNLNDFIISSEGYVFLLYFLFRTKKYMITNSTLKLKPSNIKMMSCMRVVELIS